MAVMRDLESCLCTPEYCVLELKNKSKITKNNRITE